MHAQRIQRHRAYSTSRSSTSTQTVKKNAPDSFHLDFSFRWCFLCAESHVSLHHGQENHKGHTHPVQDASCRASTSTHRARMSFTSTRPELHQICFLATVLPLHRASSLLFFVTTRQFTKVAHTQLLVPPLLVLFSSSSPSYCRSSPQIHLRGEVGRGKGGGGGGRQREREPLASKPNVATAAGPHGWGPPLEVASKERRKPWWAQLHQRQNVTLQIGNNTLSILVTVSRIHNHSKTSKLNVINSNPYPGEQ